MPAPGVSPVPDTRVKPASAPQRVAPTGSEYHGFAKGKSPPGNPGVGDVHTEWQRKQAELEARKQAWLERNAAAAAQAAAEQAVPPKTRNIWRELAAALAVIALGILCVVGWRAQLQEPRAPLVIPLTPRSTALPPRQLPPAGSQGPGQSNPASL